MNGPVPGGPLVPAAATVGTDECVGSVITRGEPVRAGRWSALWPLDDADLNALVALYTGRHGYRFRYRGLTPSPAAVIADLAQRDICRFGLWSVDGTFLGAVSAFSPSWRDGWAHIGFVADPIETSRFAVLEGLGLFIDHLFATFTFHKLYGHLPQWTYDTLRSGEGRLFQTEVLLPNLHCIEGARVDGRIVAIQRATWTDSGARHRRLLDRPKRDR